MPKVRRLGCEVDSHASAAGPRYSQSRMCRAISPLSSLGNASQEAAHRHPGLANKRVSKESKHGTVRMHSNAGKPNELPLTRLADPSASRCGDDLGVSGKDDCLGRVVRVEERNQTSRETVSRL